MCNATWPKISTFPALVLQKLQAGLLCYLPLIFTCKSYLLALRTYLYTFQNSTVLKQVRKNVLQFSWSGIIFCRAPEIAFHVHKFFFAYAKIISDKELVIYFSCFFHYFLNTRIFWWIDSLLAPLCMWACLRGLVFHCRGPKKCVKLW